MSTGRPVIVNADDFGRSNATNLGIIVAHQHGIVTSASLTVRWPAARAAASYARAYPTLGVGLHVDLGDWAWRRGQWQRRHQPVDTRHPDVVTREVHAQLARFRDLVGADPTHLDSHHGAHRDEPVRSILRAMAGELSVPLRGETPEVRHCSQFYGQTRTGRPLHWAVSVDALVQLLASLSGDATELICHPALGGGGEYSAASDEVRTLCDDRVKTAAEELQISLCTFREVPVTPPDVQAALSRGDSRLAVERLEGLARANPRRLWTWLWLARAHRAAGDPTAALRALTEAVDLAPTSVAVAEQVLAVAEVDDPDRGALERAVRALARKRPATLGRLVACVSGLQTAAARRARELFARGEPATSQRATSEGPGAAAAVARYLEMDDLAAATSLALNAPPTEIGAPQLTKTAAALAHRGNLTASLGAYDRALTLRPDDEDLQEAREAVRGERALLSRGRALAAEGGHERVTPIAERILHVVGPSLPHVRAGYTLRTQQIASAQRACGLDAQVVTELGFGGDGVDNEEIVAGVPYHRLSPGQTVPVGLDRRLKANLSALLRLVRQLRPSALHAASDYRNALLAQAAGRVFGLPVVYEVRGFWEDTWAARVGHGAESSERYQCLRAREAACARAAAAVVTLGAGMVDELLRRGVPRRRIHVVPNAVDHDVFAPRPRDADLARQLGIDSQDVVIGYISTLSSHEGVDLLLQAAAMLRAARPSLVTLIVGEGPDRRRLEALAADLGIAGRTRFTGEVPHEQMPRHYGLLDVFVVPRVDHRVTHLVTPLKPLEAMASGVPVVASDLAALRELVADGDTGRLFKAGRADSLAATLGQLLDDDDGRERLARAAREWVCRHRTWAAMGQRYREMYRALGVALDEVRERSVQACECC